MKHYEILQVLWSGFKDVYVLFDKLILTPLLHFELDHFWSMNTNNPYR